MRDHALDAHYASACSCPVNRPGVAGNPLADATLDVFEQARPRSGVIRALRNYGDAVGDHRDGLTRDRDNASRAAVNPDRRPRVFRPPTPGPHVNVRDVVTPPHRGARRSNFCSPTAHSTRTSPRSLTRC
jgi:hypothetical protein